MYEKKILSWQVRVNKETGIPYQGVLREIDNTLEAKQAYVEGHIERVCITPEIDCILNEEGKIKGLTFNRVWFYEGEPVDFFVGNLLFVRHDDEGNFTSILESDIPIIQENVKFCITVGDMIVPVDDEVLPEYEE